MNDKKEDKKAKAKADESKEENQSENGETKTNEVYKQTSVYFRSVSIKYTRYFVKLGGERKLNG